MPFFHPKKAPKSKTPLPKEEPKASSYPGSRQARAPEGEIIKHKPEPGIFGAKPFLTRRKFKRALKKDPGKVPGLGVFTQKERMEIFKKDFPRQEMGSHITPYEVSKKIRELKKKVYRSKSIAEKIKTRKKIKYLERLKGKARD